MRGARQRHMTISRRWHTAVMVMLVSGCGSHEHDGRTGPEIVVDDNHPPPWMDAGLPFDAQTDAFISDPMPSCSGAGLRVVADGQSRPSGAIALDEWDIYYGTDRGVMSVPKQGGSPRVVAASGNPHAIAVDASNVYWSSGGIYSIPKTGGVAQCIVDATTIGLAADDERLYFSNWAATPTSIQWVSKQGIYPQEPQPLVRASGQEWLPKLVVLGRDLYFVPMSTAGVSPMSRVPVEGGSVTLLATMSLVRGFALDDAFAYVAEENPSVIKRVALNGGAATGVLSSSGYPYAVGVDDRYLYATLHSLDEATRTYSGHLIRVPKTGGAPCDLGGFDSLAADLAVDRSGVYFATAGDSQSASGTVMAYP
jgi:hypothetical protein